MRWLSTCSLCFLLVPLTAAQQLERKTPEGTMTVRAVADDVIRVDYKPTGIVDKPTEILDPKGLHNAPAIGHLKNGELKTRDLTVSRFGSLVSIIVGDKKQRLGFSCDGTFSIIAPQSNLYGMRGTALGRPIDERLAYAKGILRNDGAPVAGGAQGDGGAPVAFTKNWGVIVDSVDGRFDVANTIGGFGEESHPLTFSGGSRKSLEAYIVLGPPERTMEVATQLTGHPPMPPKWTLGFLNSQWGSTEDEVNQIVDKYRSEQIPLDGFILDFDYKAWGEDNFGEWRWNSTNGPGAVGGDKFPDGASGEFGKKLLDKGVHLTGIMKPRILTQNVDLKPTMAAAEATAHNWWMPGKAPYKDYFSGRLANDLDFSNPDLRAWYWKHSLPLFETGIAAWWNDEADAGFDSLGFFHMQESLYEGQRSISNQRVWSLNRNFYLGAQRFAFGTWSGDIRTGFDNMANQRVRMLTTVDLDQPHWSMDSGGFGGHPSSENYARWIEFASMVPIMRVHGTYGQKRQPWVYGPVAEEAAKRAIEWRYAMFPSLYSWEHHASLTGVGIVRPLFWEFPNDEKSANDTDAWMMGDGLLVSPVVEQGQIQKTVYLPPGKWFDFTTNKAYDGGQEITIPVDSTTWLDMPRFVRAGTILATQPVMQYENEKPVRQITLDIWPDAERVAKFEVYDDDGSTYAYEKGKYFSQEVTAKSYAKGSFGIDFSAPTKAYKTSIETYRLRIHAPDGQVFGSVIPAGQGVRVSVNPANGMVSVLNGAPR